MRNWWKKCVRSRGPRGEATTRVSPDGFRYVKLGNRQKVPWPFAARWLVPWACGANAARWKIVTRSSTASLPVLMGLWVLQEPWGTWWRAVLAGVLVVGLAGIWRFSWRFPILVDAPAMALALGGAVAWRQGGPWEALAIILVSMAAVTKETAGIFACVWAWTPLLLPAAIIPVISSFSTRGELSDDPCDGEAHEALVHPIRTSWTKRRTLGVEGMQTWGVVYVLPWGMALLALTGPLSWPLLVGLALAYAQLIPATDSVRLYQWAAPMMIVSSVSMVSWHTVLLVAILHLANPWRGPGL